MAISPLRVALATRLGDDALLERCADAVLEVRFVADEAPTARRPPPDFVVRCSCTIGTAGDFVARCLGMACRPSAGVAAGRSRTTSAGFLSARRPWKEGWRRLPSSVHSVNATS